MGAALKLREKVSVEDYLAGELTSLERHEYIGGDIYAMGGASENHNLVMGNVAAALHGHVRGKAAKVFISAMKLKVWAQLQLFYYPDIMVVCDPTDDNAYFKTRPKVIIEVVSESTRNTDEREKLLTFMQLPSLEEYVLVEQDKMQVTIHRRSVEWVPEVLIGKDAMLHLQALDFSMPLSEIYEGVTASLA